MLLASLSNGGKEALPMSMARIRKLLSILMDSPLYLTLPLQERYSLVARMAENYPFLVGTDSEETEAGPGRTGI
jgi:hypothetical protein